MTRNKQWKRPPEPPGSNIARPAKREPDESASAWRVDIDADDHPIPAEPLHCCPYCDYNLTGLTSRRCPECGEDFSLIDARFRAKELGELGAEIRSMRRVNMLLSMFGVVIGAAGMAVPLFVSPRFLRYASPKQQLVCILVWFLFLIPIILIILRHRTDYRGGRAVLALGIVMFLLGLGMLLL